MANSGKRLRPWDCPMQTGLSSPITSELRHKLSRLASNSAVARAGLSFGIDARAETIAELAMFWEAHLADSGHHTTHNSAKQSPRRSGCKAPASRRC